MRFDTKQWFVRLGVAQVVVDIVGGIVSVILAMPGAMNIGRQIGIPGDRWSVFLGMLVQGSAGSAPTWMVLLMALMVWLSRRESRAGTAGVTFITLLALLGFVPTIGEYEHPDRYLYAGVTAGMWVGWLNLNIALRGLVILAGVAELARRYRVRVSGSL